MVKASDIRRLLQVVYKPVATNPEFKERLLKRLLGNRGKSCPNCGAEGKWHGEHETVVRNIEVGRVNDIKRNIVDVGWRCWNCGYEWGFELVREVTDGD